MSSRIAHISDMHVGSVHFVPNLMNRVVTELNELSPDLIVCTGDFTNEGFRQEYKSAAAYLQQIRPPTPAGSTPPGRTQAGSASGG